MNVLWTKGRLNKILSTEKANIHASGDGAPGPVAGRCCRLCGGDKSLRAFGDTYLWEGVEERYDQLLYDCFGVRVTPSDCLICEWCVRQLRCTERFKALVHAAFDKPPSSSNHSLSLSPKRQKSDEEIAKANDKEKSLNNKNIIALLKSNMVPDKKKSKVSEMRANLNSSHQSRRTNIQCKMCKQKYPMIVSCSGGKDFICSRCKKNIHLNSIFKKFNVGNGVTKDKNGLNSKDDTKGKKRYINNGSLFLSKKPSTLKRQHDSPTRKRNIAKYKCAICQKIYAAAEQLAEHIKAQHNICPLCRKDMRTKDMLEKHMQMHKDHISLNYFLAGPAKFAKTKRDVKARTTREKRL